VPPLPAEERAHGEHVPVLRGPAVKRWFQVQAKGEWGPSLLQAESAKEAAVAHVEGERFDEMGDDEWTIAVRPVVGAPVDGGWASGAVVVHDGPEPESVFLVRRVYTTVQLA
jgi:hypothetical protein